MAKIISSIRNSFTTFVISDVVPATNTPLTGLPIL